MCHACPITGQAVSCSVRCGKFRPAVKLRESAKRWVQISRACVSLLDACCYFKAWGLTISISLRQTNVCSCSCACGTYVDMCVPAHVPQLIAPCQHFPGRPMGDRSMESRSCEGPGWQRYPCHAPARVLCMCTVLA